VLLSSEPEAESRAIKFAAGGRYSHAALVADRWDILRQPTIARSLAYRRCFLTRVLLQSASENGHLWDVTGYARWMSIGTRPRGHQGCVRGFQTNVRALATSISASRMALCRSCFASSFASCRGGIRSDSSLRYIRLRSPSTSWLLTMRLGRHTLRYVLLEIRGSSVPPGWPALFDRVRVMPRAFAARLHSVTRDVIITGDELLRLNPWITEATTVDPHIYRSSTGESSGPRRQVVARRLFATVRQSYGI